MCLGVPGEIVEVLDPERGLAKVDVGGVRREISTALVEGAAPGDWVLIHVGFALSKIDEAQAQEMLDALALLGEPYEQELADLRASCVTCSDEAVEARVVAVDGDTAIVAADGRSESVGIELVAPVAVGELLLCHAGIALERVER
jgi:hydrogenase expression/formation protein HypC